MKRACLAAAAALAACAPRPCTKALCPVKAEGLFDVRGITTVPVAPGSPLPAVPPDAWVDVRSGRVEFKVRRSRVAAEEGASFRFFLSSGAPALEVSSGVVSVALSSAPFAPVPAGVILLQ